MKKQIEQMYANFMAENNAEPRYAGVTIQFLDDGSLLDVTIKLYGNVGADDDEIFYYCDSLCDLLSLTEQGVEDFVINQIHEFHN